MPALILLMSVSQSRALCSDLNSTQRNLQSLFTIVAPSHCPQRFLMHVCVCRLSGALVNMQRSGQLTSVTAANR